MKNLTLLLSIFVSCCLSGQVSKRDTFAFSVNHPLRPYYPFSAFAYFEKDNGTIYNVADNYSMQFLSPVIDTFTISDAYYIDDAFLAELRDTLWSVKIRERSLSIRLKNAVPFSGFMLRKHYPSDTFFEWKRKIINLGRYQIWVDNPKQDYNITVHDNLRDTMATAEYLYVYENYTQLLSKNITYGKGDSVESSKIFHAVDLSPYPPIKDSLYELDTGYFSAGYIPELNEPFVAAYSDSNVLVYTPISIIKDTLRNVRGYLTMKYAHEKHVESIKRVIENFELYKSKPDQFNNYFDTAEILHQGAPDTFHIFYSNLGQNDIRKEIKFLNFGETVWGEENDYYWIMKAIGEPRIEIKSYLCKIEVYKRKY